MVRRVASTPHDVLLITACSGEEKPRCTNCERQGETCDYSIRLNWGGRSKKDRRGTGSDASSAASGSPYESTFTFEDNVFSSNPETYTRPHHARSRSQISPPRSSTQAFDPDLTRNMPQASNRNDAANDGLYFQSDILASTPYTHAQFHASISDATNSSDIGFTQ